MIDGSQTWLNLAKLHVHAYYQDANLAIIDFKNGTSPFWRKLTTQVEGSSRLMVLLPKSYTWAEGARITMRNYELLILTPP